MRRGRFWRIVNTDDMERKDLITKVRQFFSIEELVCPYAYRKWGQRCWQFLDTAFLETLYVIRKDILGVPMYCNIGEYTQRGFAVISVRWSRTRVCHIFWLMFLVRPAVS